MKSKDVKAILCITCTKCLEGEFIDDYLAMFKCGEYDIKVYGARYCNSYVYEGKYGENVPKT